MVGRFLQADSISDGNNIFGQNLYMYVNGNPMKYSDPDGKRACGARTNGTIALLLTENPFYSAASGVAPGHNYTGNGSCASSQPRWEYAYIELFINYYNDSNVSGQDKLALLFATNLYVKEGKRTGRGTFLDGININRKEYSNLLIAGV